MDNYITGKIIRDLRIKKDMTQLELANMIHVSDKTISKWETSKGLPDIVLIEDLAKALNISVLELMKGNCIVNKNKNGNMLKSKLYVCPICGNVISSIGEIVVSCCCVSLSECEYEESDSTHVIRCDIVENEYYVLIDHSMSKDHYISFIAYLTTDRIQIKKLYPEERAEARFLRRGRGIIYIYCNRDGLIGKKYRGGL